jgi:SAM-dependent methyltransferase
MQNDHSSSHYIPKEYWLTRGKIYMSNFRYNKRFQLQERMLIEYLRTIDFESVLEVGCGFGRITSQVIRNFPRIRDYLAVDLSPDQIRNAQEYIKPVEVNSNINLKFIVSEIQSIQVARRFDLVLASEVLMHILPKDISKVITILVQLAKKHVINIDWFEDPVPQQRPDTWNFVHPYEMIYKNMPSINQVFRIPIIKKGMLGKLDARQSIFHAVITPPTDAPQYDTH